MRIWIGGVSQDLTSSQLQERLSSYGRVENLEIPMGMEGQHRGYAFADFDCNEEQWKKCLNTLNGSTWKGRKVRLAKVRNLPFEERPLQKVTDKEKPGKKQKLRRRKARLSKDTFLVTEDNMSTKRRDWWYRGKYGRPVAVMKMRVRGGRLTTIDPAHYKERGEKLFGGDGVRPKPFGKLCWTFDDPSNTAREGGCVDYSDSDEAGDGMAGEKKVAGAESGTEENPVHKETAQIAGTLEASAKTRPVVVMQKAWSELYSTQEAFKFTAPSEPMKPIVTKDTPVKRDLEPREPRTLSTLLRDLHTLEPLSVFYRSATFEEVRYEWIKQRSELRRDFRRRVKQAKRITSKKQKIQ